MADTIISTRALTYRDPTISAAAEIQLRRNRQRSFDALVDQAQRTADAAAQVSDLEQSRADGFRAAKDAADQSNSAAEQQTEQAALAGSRAGVQTDNPAAAQGSGDTTGTAQTQPTVTFTTQQIAQEQLGTGLHVPPLQPADEAYRRAGAEPPLPSEDSQPSLFALAV